MAHFLLIEQPAQTHHDETPRRNAKKVAQHLTVYILCAALRRCKGNKVRSAVRSFALTPIKYYILERISSVLGTDAIEPFGCRWQPSVGSITHNTHTHTGHNTCEIALFWSVDVEWKVRGSVVG